MKQLTELELESVIFYAKILNKSILRTTLILPRISFYALDEEMKTFSFTNILALNEIKSFFFLTIDF